MEYDLDTEDKTWLEKFNGGQDRLPAPRFELLLWKLEMVNADANDRQSAALGELTLLQIHHSRTCLGLDRIL